MKIKARVWDIDSGKMSAGIDIDRFMSGDEDLQFPETDESLPFKDFLFFRKEYSDWMLFTGKTDKNGKEIYQANIVKCIWQYDGHTNEDHEITAIVLWDEHHASWVILNEREDCFYPLHSFERWELCEDTLEVIGNGNSDKELMIKIRSYEQQLISNMGKR
jgi:uncharacterized phage protein (TIGR01671 family)